MPYRVSIYTYQCVLLTLFIILTGLKVLVAAESSEFSLASYYGDWMVLQGSPYRAVIWGYSTRVGDGVSLTIPGICNLSTSVSPSPGSLRGLWSFILPVVEDTAPHNITIVSSAGILSLNHVLFGDVWICSGQSNMAFRMEQINNATLEIQAALKYHQIRLFMVSKVQSFSPLDDLQAVDTPWTKPTQVSVASFSALCLFYAMNIHDRLKCPLGIITAAWDGTAIETWSSPEVLSGCGSRLHQFNNPHGGISSLETEKKWFVPGAHTVLWNAMIHPLLDMTIYGVIWYQGESNGGSGFYKCAFHAMIQDWRLRFSQSHGQTSSTFPFGFVQLAPNRPGKIISYFSNIRWQQTYGYGYVPNPEMKSVFMAVAIDLPDFDSPHGALHPRFKKDIAWRLSRSGLAIGYGQRDVFYQGPFPQTVTVIAETLIQIEFNSTLLDIRNNTGFEVCCSPRPESDRSCTDIDPSWVLAPIVTVTRTSVTLNTDKCQNVFVTKIRYAWRESPCEFKACAVYGRVSNLPTPPFILDVPEQAELNWDSHQEL